jgi:uncharacterized coiled-coil protein SlyX
MPDPVVVAAQIERLTREIASHKATIRRARVQMQLAASNLGELEAMYARLVHGAEERPPHGQTAPSIRPR